MTLKVGKRRWGGFDVVWWSGFCSEVLGTLCFCRLCGSAHQKDVDKDGELDTRCQGLFLTFHSQS